MSAEGEILPRRRTFLGKVLSRHNWRGLADSCYLRECPLLVTIKLAGTRPNQVRNSPASCSRPPLWSTQRRDLTFIRIDRHRRATRRYFFKKRFRLSLAYFGAAIVAARSASGKSSCSGWTRGSRSECGEPASSGTVSSECRSQNSKMF